MSIVNYDNSSPSQVYYAATDVSFVTGDSPVTLDVNTGLSKNANDGYIINDGLGDFIVNLSSDGGSFGDDILVKYEEVFSLKSLDVDSIKITWVTDSSLRVFAK